MSVHIQGRSYGRGVGLSEEQIQAAILLNDKFIQQLERIAKGKGN